MIAAKMRGRKAPRTHPTPSECVRVEFINQTTKIGQGMYEIAKTLGKLRNDLIKQGFTKENAELIATKYLDAHLADLAANGEPFELTAPHEEVYGKGEKMSLNEARNWLMWAK